MYSMTTTPSASFSSAASKPPLPFAGAGTWSSFARSNRANATPVITTVSARFAATSASIVVIVSVCDFRDR